MNSMALITGASRGIGRSIACKLARDRVNLILSARSGDQLDNLAGDLQNRYGIDCHPLPCDLSAADAALRLNKEVEKRNLHVDILVNNAGMGSYGDFHEMSFEKLQNTMRLNMESLTNLTYLILPDMIERDHGYIMNVASTAAFQPGPTMTIYYATKAYVLYFSEGLAGELSDRNIEVTALCPGPTQTRFHEIAGSSGNIINSFLGMDPDKVAYKGVKGMKKGKQIVIPGILNKIGVFAVRFLPRRLITSIVKFLHKK